MIRIDWCLTHWPAIIFMVSLSKETKQSEQACCVFICFIRKYQRKRKEAEIAVSYCLRKEIKERNIEVCDFIPGCTSTTAFL